MNYTRFQTVLNDDGGDDDKDDWGRWYAPTCDQDQDMQKIRSEICDC